MFESSRGLVGGLVPLVHPQRCRVAVVALLAKEEGRGDEGIGEGAIERASSTRGMSEGR